MRLLPALVLLVLVAVLPSAYGRAGADPGVTDDQILIGGTVPLSGDQVAYAAVARGADAYFKYVNSRGGVRGRQIKYLYVDDAYNTGRDGPEDARARPGRQGLRDLQQRRDRARARRPAVSEPGRRPAALRRERALAARPRTRPLPVVDGLPASIRRRGGALRPVRRAHAAEGEDRRPPRGLGVRPGHVHGTAPRAREALDAGSRPSRPTTSPIPTSTRRWPA